MYDDGDEEQYDESNLKEGVSLFQSKPPAGFPGKKIKRFKACGKGLYDFSWVAASSLTERELEEYKLHLFTHNLTHAVEDPADGTDSPLGELISERKEKKRLWENN